MGQIYYRPETDAVNNCETYNPPVRDEDFFKINLEKVPVETLFKEYFKGVVIIGEQAVDVYSLSQITDKFMLIYELQESFETVFFNSDDDIWIVNKDNQAGTASTHNDMD